MKMPSPKPRSRSLTSEKEKVTADVSCQLFELSQKLELSQLRAALLGRFQCLTTRPRRLQLKYYDTFDWRLFGRRLILTWDGKEYRLLRAGDQSRVDSVPASEAIVFWPDCPDGDLQVRLRRWLGERALIPMGENHLRVQDIRLLNADRKTVVRLRLEEGEAMGGPSTPIRLIRVLPVRGYAKDASRLAGLLSKFGLSPARATAFERAVEAIGRRPGDYSSKLQLQLDPSMTAQRAGRVIFRHLLDVMQSNEWGLCKDVDIEFLHDFRVATRRTRAGLQQMKGVFPELLANDFRSRFARLAAATNRLRDLDVYLLNQGRYTGMLDQKLRSGLEPLFRRLKVERGRELVSVVKVLEGKLYRHLVRDWGATLRGVSDQPLEAPRAAIPVKELASRLIRKRYRRVLKAGEQIRRDSPDSDLHRLRINCKKLRYLLEFFFSLYSPAQMESLVKQLKRLQDHLGEFNDLSVQQDHLWAFLKIPKSSPTAETAAAVGALTATLGMQQHRVRNRFGETFGVFAGPESRRLFRKTFGKAGRD